MTIRAVSNNYHVCGQIEPENVAAIAQAGYAAIICMRPDGEAPDQPPYARIEAAAKSSGIPIFFIAARSGAVSPEAAKALRHLLDTTEGVIFSYCASGSRCTLAYHLAMQDA